MARKMYTGSMVFTPASKTIQFTGGLITALRQVLLIVNQTRQETIFSFADAALGGTFLGDTLTLEFNTAAHGAGDVLQVFYEPEGADAIAAVLDSTAQAQMEVLQDVAEAIQELASRLAFLSGVRGTAADLRVTVLSAPTTAVTMAGGTVANTVGTPWVSAPMAVIPFGQNHQSELAYIGNINRCSA